MSIDQEIRRKARELGFDAVGVAAPDALGTAAGEALARFIRLGLHGGMGWLADTAERRADPRVLWPPVRSVVMVAMNYGPTGDPSAAPMGTGRGVISVYARNRDYHDVLKKRLKALGRWIEATYGAQSRAFVDTAPVMEKPLARSAGLGWQGKHTNLVSRQFGSWLFLGALFTTLALAADPAEGDHCGSCRACLDACPTGALPAPYRIDARRCVSYLTIEHKGHIPRELRPAIGNRIYGCDDCLAACPWNKFAKAAREAAFHAREVLTETPLVALARLDDAAFRALFSGSPIKRLKRDRFVRNVLIALGNAADEDAGTEARPVVEELLDDPSPLVRAMAVWALGRLAGGAGTAALGGRRLARERDPAVAAEWRAVIRGRGPAS